MIFFASCGNRQNFYYYCGYVFITGSGYEEINYTRKDVFNIVKELLNNGFASLIKIVKEKISEKSGRSVQVPEDSKATFSMLFNKMRSRWQQAHRSEGVIFKYNDKWPRDKY